MTGVVGAVDESKFNAMFKRRLTALFRDPAKNFKAIQLLLVEMVQWVGKGWRFPSHEIREEVEQDVVTHALSVFSTETVDTSKNPAGYFRTTINHAFSQSASRLISGSAEPMDDVAEADAKLPATNEMGAAHRALETADHLVTDEVSVGKISVAIDAELKRYIDQTVAGCDGDYQILQAISEGSVFALQKLRMRVIGSYFPCAVGRRKFYADHFSMVAGKDGWNHVEEE